MLKFIGVMIYGGISSGGHSKEVIGSWVLSPHNLGLSALNINRKSVSCGVMGSHEGVG